MGKHISFDVKESELDLRLLIRKESSPKNILRLQSLLHIKEGNFVRQVDLASHLGYSVRNMELWLKLYKEGGIEAMLLNPSEKRKYKRKITQEVHDGLSERLYNPEQGFLSYVQAVQWVKDTYGIEYKYNTLRDYMIDFFGSKIKQPRKSHIKKSDKAEADFLKLT